MPEPILAYDGYDYVELELPVTGQRLRLKAMGLTNAIHFIRLGRKVQDASLPPNEAMDALLELVETFPKALGDDPAIAAAFERLTPLEVKSAMWDFFSQTRLGRELEPSAPPPPASVSTT